MRIENRMRLAVLGFLGAATLLAQDVPLDPRSSISINFAKDSPVAVLNVATGESRATARGAALVLDLHMSLTLRNLGASRIHGVTLRVVSQEVTLGGKGSVAYPSLNVGPGEAFPVRIDMQLVRPTQAAGRAAGGSESGRRALPGPFLLRRRPAQLAAHHDRLGNGGAARSRTF